MLIIKKDETGSIRNAVYSNLMLLKGTLRENTQLL
jgi:hypothetical protein